MTKADIKSRLMVIQQRCKGYRRKALKETEAMYDYEHGKAVAYEDIASWIEDLIDKMDN